MKKKFLAILLIIISLANARAQYYTNENKVWTFGLNAGLDFNSGIPVAIGSSLFNQGGTASVCNSSGTLLFYTDGNKVYRASGTLMPTGGGLIMPPGTPTTSPANGALIVPKIGSSTQYYVFGLEEGIGAPICKVWSCVVDMSLAGGLGDIVAGTISAAPMVTGVTTKMIAIQGNACNIWLMLHKIDEPKFLAYEITSSGISAVPVVSTSGIFTTALPIGGTNVSAYITGEMKVSPDRTKIATGAHGFVFGPLGAGTELYDFDVNTGIVSNCRVLDSESLTQGVEFSPDNSKLYTVEEIPIPVVTPVTSERVSQFDISLPTTAAMIASRYTLLTSPILTAASQLKLGPDNKIYKVHHGPLTQFLDVINNPNLAGAACNFVLSAVSLSPHYGSFGFPNTVVKVLPGDTTTSRHDTSACLSGSSITIASHDTGSSYIWSTGATGATTTVSSSGLYWVATHSGCEMKVDTIKVTLHTTPAPTITGNTEYCQGVGPYTPVTVHTTATGSVLWYTSATGGVGSSATPTVNVNTAGISTFYVSQTDSSCESSRVPVTITVHAKPGPPAVSPSVYCQYAVASPLVVTGTDIMWYGPGVTAGYTTAPVINTDTAGVKDYYVTQTSSYGCVSDSAHVVVKVNPKPVPPVANNTSYCRFALANPLTATGSGLKWYNAPAGGVGLTGTPTPPTASAGDIVWYVSQTVNGCESDRVPLTVSIWYTPDFVITAEKNYVCEGDSITLSYSSHDTNQVNYHWIIPDGVIPAVGSDLWRSSVTLKFTELNTTKKIYLSASGGDGKCSRDTSFTVKAVEKPVATAYCKPNICIGDTTSLALIYRSLNAVDYTWQIDNTTLGSAKVADIVTANSDHGGPFLISWNDTGIHIIALNVFTAEGCQNGPFYDTVDIHSLPDATFKMAAKNGSICLEDSVQFIANKTDYSYMYQWSPAHSFDNVNKPATWGRVEQNGGMITLSVTDAFGCVGTYSEAVNPGECCKVFFPNAFTPAATSNNRYRPVLAGYHRFHIFRIANRWGQTVFESSTNVPEWDGSYGGVPQDAGTYFYYVKYDCGGKVLEQKGDVTLIR